MTFFMFLRCLLAPPAVNILLVLLGLWLLRRQWRRTGMTLVALALLSLYVIATPWGAGLLARHLATDPPLDVTHTASWQGAQVIVVLGGGRGPAPEFDGSDMPNYWTASRLRYGAYLYRQTGLPLLVSGGTVLGEKEPEAAVMARSLIRDYIVNVRWQEDRSRNTWENAQFTHEVLAPKGIRHIILVTQGLHMRRARLAFEHAGFQVTPAPVDVDAGDTELPGLLRLAPSPTAFMRSAQALHEYAGLIVYRMRARLD